MNRKQEELLELEGLADAEELERARVAIASLELREKERRERKDVDPYEGFEGTIVRLPRKWGKLSNSAKWEEEVEWVHQNRLYVVGTTSSGMVSMNWTLAREKPPSSGAVAMMQSAANNPQWFDRDILPKAKRGMGEDEADRLRQEKHSISEIRELLESMRISRVLIEKQ